jgi:hypothetical protein
MMPIHSEKYSRVSNFEFVDETLEINEMKQALRHTFHRTS